MKNVIITGATGMIGGLVLEHCLLSPEVTKVISLARRSSGIQHEKLNEVIISDFLKLDRNAPNFESVDIVFYCLGVYAGTVDREQFRRVTVEYPESLAQVLLSRGAPACHLSC